jgi:hypothetical protein
MTATETRTGRLVVHPDDYLDCRRPGWETYEARGLVRFERELGSKSPMVFVDRDCVEVLQALRISSRSGCEAPREPPRGR